MDSWGTLPRLCQGCARPGPARSLTRNRRENAAKRSPPLRRPGFQADRLGWASGSRSDQRSANDRAMEAQGGAERSAYPGPVRLGPTSPLGLNSLPSEFLRSNVSAKR